MADFIVVTNGDRYLVVKTSNWTVWADCDSNSNATDIAVALNNA